MGLRLLALAVLLATPAFLKAQELRHSDGIVLSAIENLFLTEGIFSLGIQLDVREGNVTFQGTVQDREAELRITSLARTVEGVNSVSSRLEIEGARRDTGSSNRNAPSELQVENACGGVRIVVDTGEQMTIRAARSDRPLAEGDVSVAHTENSTLVGCRLADGAAVDIEITVPYGMRVRVATTSGPIEYIGFGQAQLQTATGDVSLTCPWDATRFDLRGGTAPANFAADSNIASHSLQSYGWNATDRLPETRIAWGSITLASLQPGRVALKPLGGVPDDSPIKMPWQARELLPRLFRRFGPRRLESRDGKPSAPDPRASDATFSADVRLVHLNLSVSGPGGRPAPGLTAEDFEVIDDGKRQSVSAVAAGELPFNLVLMLDCSSSTERERGAIEQAARRFVDVARPQDRVAIYALADTVFQVLTPLTTDHDTARSRVTHIQRFGGATPLYDAILLSYAQELPKHPRERNALVLLTDGLDNSLVGQLGLPSSVTFRDLEKAVQEMDSLIYTIVLDPPPSALSLQRQGADLLAAWRRTAAKQANELAKASGGKYFVAASLDDLDTVYEKVAEDLRSVYTLQYYPSNQKFDGEWRRVRVRAKARGVTVRTRPGYYAY